MEDSEASGNLSIFYSRRIPRGLPRGFHACTKPDPEGQNPEIPRQLAAGIGILKVLLIYFEFSIAIHRIAMECHNIQGSILGLISLRVNSNLDIISPTRLR